MPSPRSSLKPLWGESLLQAGETRVERGRDKIKFVNPHTPRGQVGFSDDLQKLANVFRVKPAQFSDQFQIHRVIASGYFNKGRRGCGSHDAWKWAVEARRRKNGKDVNFGGPRGVLPGWVGSRVQRQQQSKKSTWTSEVNAYYAVFSSSTSTRRSGRTAGSRTRSTNSSPSLLLTLPRVDQLQVAWREISANTCSRAEEGLPTRGRFQRSTS